MPDNKHDKRMRHAHVCVARPRIRLSAEIFQISIKAEYANA